MDQQGSTPDSTVSGVSHSSPSSADMAAPAAPSQPQNGDLLGNLQFSQETGTPVTDTPSQPTQDPTPQPDPQNPGPAPAGDSVAPAVPAPHVDADPELIKWASSQNISLNTPTEVALAKRLRDSQKAFHEKSASLKLAETTAQLEDQGYVNDDTSDLNMRLKRFEFFDANPEAKTLEADMVDYCIGLAEAGDVEGFNYFRNNWNQLYSVVKATKATQPAGQDPAVIAEVARQEERANLAKAQQAAAPTAAAVSSTPKPQLSVEEQIANMTQAEYNEWRKTNNPFAS